jgi:aryl-alcohol dehydrogenase-like predicted oxidoreductase
MQSRALGPTASQVSAVGFGGMPLSIEGRPPEPVAIATIHAALDAGVTLIDTADVYCLSHLDLGHNERLIAAALKSWKGSRESLVVATKGGMERPDGAWTRNGRPEHLFRACDRSLKNLGVERIQLYQLHAPDPQVPFKESIEALAELVRRGKVQWIGISNVSVAEIEEAREIHPIQSVQNRLSPFFTEALDDDLVQDCVAKGLSFLAYSPVGGGRLNKKLPDHPVVKRIAERHHVSPHVVVLAWVRAQGSTVIPIPGARTPEHARDSATAADITLEGANLQAIDAAEFSIAR